MEEETNHQVLVVGEYTISPWQDDLWIENKKGEGMQVFNKNFEKLIDDFFKSEF